MSLNDFDRAKALQFIKNANQIIFFAGVSLLAIIAVGGFLLNLFFGFGHRARVELANVGGSKSAKKVRTIYSQSYYGKVKDTYVFSLSSTIITPDGIHDSGADYNERMRSKRNDYVHQPAVNLIFVGPDNSKQFLFKKDSLIRESHLANFDKKQGQLLNGNIYEVSIEDTNEDGFLDYRDKKALYISSYNGMNASLVLNDIESHQVVGDNTVLIVKRGKKQKNFYEYKVDSNKLTQLNTST